MDGPEAVPGNSGAFGTLGSHMDVHFHNTRILDASVLQQYPPTEKQCCQKA